MVLAEFTWMHKNFKIHFLFKLFHKIYYILTKNVADAQACSHQRQDYYTFF